MRRVTMICLVLLAGCTDRSIGSGSDTKTAGSSQDPSADNSSAKPANACDGTAPYCVPACSSDWLQGQASCVDGTWTCPNGLVRLDQCPANTCFGPAASDAEMCGPNGWECHPTEADFQSCPDFLCPECTGFDGPVTMDGCSCSCQNGSVVCEPLVPPPI
jgi:hypothetical protein